MSFIRTGLREIGLKIRRQKTRIALRHEKRVLQKSEINLGREGCSQAVNFPEVRNEIVALKKLEQEQKEVALRIATIEEGIRKIELQRDQNAKEQNAALAKLEEEKKPILQRQNEAKAAADLCDRELASVERRLQENDAADRELLKKLTELQAQVPPPDDLETQMAGISARRIRLPEEKAEITRARLGAADACRAAREKLAAQEAAVAAIDKNIAKVREEYEARDRVLNEQSRAQQDALKDARGHHEIVEEKKNPAYLNIGRHLASQGIAPPNAPHLLADVQKHRAAVERHSQHTAELAVLSSQIDKQELRKFYFAGLSVVVLMAIVLLVVFQSPQKREWLPQETDTILSVNLGQLEREDLPKRWRKDQANEWQNVWAGLIASAQRTPVLNLSRDAARVTRAMATTDSGTTHEYVLVEAGTDVSRVVDSIERDKAFERRTISGLPMWLRPEYALARVGPKTLAIGGENEVASLARVRLGIDPDLKITGPLFDRLQSLKEGNALRLVSREPAKLDRMFSPIFNSELLEKCDLLGLSLTLQSPVKARLILKAKTPEAAGELVARIRNEPQRLLKLAESDFLFYAQPPEVDVQGMNVQVRFDVPENSARLLLQRLAKIVPAPAVAAE
ncbi:MAG: hypothetical protein DME97_05855 [Verrucomicrobia bacterium]|nr:MAG: hypothetical protein DME97_05855 [Verrucomicrobiota bacterium]